MKQNAGQRPNGSSFKILFVLPFPPRLDGVHGGSRVAAQLIHRLAERHKVAVLYLRGSDELEIDPCVAACCSVVEAIFRPEPASSPASQILWRLRVAMGVVQGIPRWVLAWDVKAFRQALHRVVRLWKPDVIQFEHATVARYASSLRKKTDALRVLSLYESVADAFADRLQQHRGRGRLTVAAGLLTWRRYERTIFRLFDEIVVFSDRDAAAVRNRLPGASVTRIPFGAELPVETCNPVGTSQDVLFVGNFHHPPNIHAGDRLVRSIFPKVVSEIPDARLLLIGDNPPAHLNCSPSKVIVAGRVPDVHPYMDSAAVVVAPLSTGGGMRVKVLEALAAGKAVVASPRALEGLEVTDGVHVLVARDDAEFSAAIVELLRSAQARHTLATAARDWAASNLGWAKSVALWERLYSRAPA